MKSLVFDTGPIISMTMNNLLWLLEPLKTNFNGEFYITEAVKRELVDRPLQTKKFKFEALQVLKYISKDTLKIASSNDIEKKAYHLLHLANNSFRAKGHYIKVVHYGEIEALAAAIILGSSALVTDERTIRHLVEKPDQEFERLQKKLHTQIEINNDNFNQFKKEVAGLKVIRSVELVTIAYEIGLLDLYTTEKEKKILPDLKKTLLESVLWGVKLQGCAVSTEEIDDIIKLETKKS